VRGVSKKIPFIMLMFIALIKITSAFPSIWRDVAGVVAAVVVAAVAVVAVEMTEFFQWKLNETKKNIKQTNFAEMT